MNEKPQPLKGIRVIELGTHVAVPSATRLLADFGAEVIKIEKPGGDPYRSFGDQYGTPIEEDYNPFFTFHNANKKLISLNLKTESGRNILFGLLEKADVFITNVRHKALECMEIDYSAVKKKFPHLIYYHFTSLGLKGAEACKAGFDTGAFWGRSGSLLDMVTEGAMPAHPVLGAGDMGAGAMMAYGILAAYIGRLRTGKGTFVTSSLYGTGVHYMAAGVISAQEKFHKQFPQDAFHPDNPFRHYYLCKDRTWIALAAQSYNRMWKDLCRVFGLEDWADLEDYSTEERARAAGVVPLIVNRLNEIFLTRKRDEWAAILDAEDISYEKLNHYKDVSKDPQAWANGYLSTITFRGEEEVIVPNSPVWMSDYGKLKIRPQGGIGCDAKDLLDSLGEEQDFKEQEIPDRDNK